MISNLTFDDKSGDISWKYLAFDEHSGDISWEYEGKTYNLKEKNIYDVKAFEKEKRILVLCGAFTPETHLYAYDFYGNFMFEVMPPSENYHIVHITDYPKKKKGEHVMAMFCLSKIDTDDCFDSAYCIDPNTGELTFAGRIKY